MLTASLKSPDKLLKSAIEVAVVRLARMRSCRDHHDIASESSPSLLRLRPRAGSTSEKYGQTERKWYSYPRARGRGFRICRGAKPSFAPTGRCWDGFPATTARARHGGSVVEEDLEFHAEVSNDSVSLRTAVEGAVRADVEAHC